MKLKIWDGELHPMKVFNTIKKNIHLLIYLHYTQLTTSISNVHLGPT